MEVTKLICEFFSQLKLRIFFLKKAKIKGV